MGTTFNIDLLETNGLSIIGSTFFNQFRNTKQNPWNFNGNNDSKYNYIMELTDNNGSYTNKIMDSSN